LGFENQLHELFLKDLELHKSDATFSVSSFFVSHQNPNISLLAAELLTEKYQLSKIFSKNEALEKNLQSMTSAAKRRIEELKKQEEERRKIWLINAVTNSINEYQKAIVSLKIKELERVLRDNSTEDIVAVMKEHARLSEIKRMLASALGQVVIK
jgi:DNA primase